MGKAWARHRLAPLATAIVLAGLSGTGWCGPETQGLKGHAVCGIRFKAPKALPLQVQQTDGSCRLCLSAHACKPDQPYIELLVIRKALSLALVKDGDWEQVEGEPLSWRRLGYSIGQARLETRGRLQRLSTDFSINCGPSRAPGEAQACDAFGGAISDGRSSVVIEALEFNQDAARLLDSIRFQAANPTNPRP